MQIFADLIAIFKLHDISQDFLGLDGAYRAKLFLDTRNGRRTHAELADAHRHEQDCSIRIAGHLAAHSGPDAVFTCRTNRALYKRKHCRVEMIVEIGNIVIAAVYGQRILNEIRSCRC